MASNGFLKIGETTSAVFKKLATYTSIDPVDLSQIHIGRNTLNDSDGNEYNTANPLPTKTDGVAGTGITPETGASGSVGWLSSIYKRLSGTLSVSATSLPLPTGAASDSTVAGVTSAITNTSGSAGANPPTIVGTGVIGWLRGIFELLSGTVKTTSTQVVVGTGKLDGVTVTNLEQLMKTLIAEQRLNNILLAEQSGFGDNLDKLRAEILVDLNK
jgi:hypothetical protein